MVPVRLYRSRIVGPKPSSRNGLSWKMNRTLEKGNTLVDMELHVFGEQVLEEAIRQAELDFARELEAFLNQNGRGSGFQDIVDWGQSTARPTWFKVSWARFNRHIG